MADVFFGDADMIGFFQRLVGYSLLGRPDEDVLAIPYGSGSNGKSTVLGAIRDAPVVVATELAVVAPATEARLDAAVEKVLIQGIVRFDVLRAVPGREAQHHGQRNR